MATPVRELITRLVFKVDKDSATRADSTGESVKKAGKKAAEGWQDVSARFGLAIDGLKKMGEIARGVFNALIGGFAKTADAQGKLASAIGIGVQELGAWQFAAQGAGIETTDINTALGKFGRRMQDAISGNQDARKAFKDLGITIADLKNPTLGIQGNMKKLADGFAKLGPGAKRTALSMKFFEESGLKFVPLLANGSKGLDEAFEKFRKLGGGTDEAGAKIAANFNDKVLEATTAIKGLRNRIAVRLLPTLTAMVDKFTAFVTNGDRVAKVLDVIKLAARVLGSILATMAAKQLVAVVASMGLWIKSLFTVSVASKQAALGTRILAGATRALSAALKTTGILLIAAALQDLFSLVVGKKSVIGEALGAEGAEGLKGAVTDIARALKSILALLAPVLSVIIKIAAVVIKGIVLGFQAIPAVLKRVGALANQAAGVVRDGWNATIGAIVGFVERLIDKLEQVGQIARLILIPFQVIRRAIGGIITFFTNALDAVRKGINRAAKFLGLGGDVVKTVALSEDIGRGAAATSAAAAPTAAAGAAAGPTTMNVTNNISGAGLDSAELGARIGQVSGETLKRLESEKLRQAAANIGR